MYITKLSEVGSHIMLGCRAGSTYFHPITEKEAFMAQLAGLINYWMKIC